MHAPNQPNRSQNIDLSLPTARDRAKSYLSSLQRHGRVRAIVQVRALTLACDRLPAHDGPFLTIRLLLWQFSMNGARFKLLIPKENCVIIFSLAGIRCPQTSRNGSEAEPYADEAFAFSRSLCFQREVDIETEAVDKNGTFFGRCDPSCPKYPSIPSTHPTTTPPLTRVAPWRLRSLFLPDKRSLGVVLLEAGLAQRIPPAADRRCAATPPHFIPLRSQPVSEH